ncbi:hypothetical protein Q7P37_010320 [Cladosporium fusiforme]
MPTITAYTPAPAFDPPAAQPIFPSIGFQPQEHGVSETVPVRQTHKISAQVLKRREGSKKAAKTKRGEEKNARTNQARLLWNLEDFLESSLGYKAAKQQKSGNRKRSGLRGDKQEQEFLKEALGTIKRASRDYDNQIPPWSLFYDGANDANPNDRTVEDRKSHRDKIFKRNMEAMRKPGVTGEELDKSWLIQKPGFEGLPLGLLNAFDSGSGHTMASSV